MTTGETVMVASTEVVCDGEAGVSGHPRVFLHIKREEGTVTCPYCSRHFMLGSLDNHHAA